MHVGWTFKETHLPRGSPTPVSSFPFSLQNHSYQPSTHCTAEPGESPISKVPPTSPKFLVRPSQLLLGTVVIVSASQNRIQLERLRCVYVSLGDGRRRAKLVGTEGLGQGLWENRLGHSEKKSVNAGEPLDSILQGRGQLSMAHRPSLAPSTTWFYMAHK